MKGNILFRTPEGLGYHKVITQNNSELSYLSYHRLRLGEGQKMSLETAQQEACLLCLEGIAAISLNGHTWKLNQKDALYLPPGSKYQVKNMGEGILDCPVALALSTADSEPVFISFEQANRDPERHKVVGRSEYQRDVIMMVGPAVKADRLLVGYTIGRKGQWTSWPPHQHVESQEEIYLYYGIPKPGFGIQLVYTSLDEVQLCAVVRNGDAVAVSSGYHPTVGIPGFANTYIWMIAAKDPRQHRRTDVATTQPEFASMGTAVFDNR